MNIVATVVGASGGMVGDDRSTARGVTTLIKHADPVSRPHRVTPYNAVQTADASASTHAITDYISYAGALYGLGSDGSNPQVWTKDSLTSGTAWTGITNTTSSGAAVPGVFVQYKGNAYGAHNDGTIWKAALGGGWTNNETTLAAACTSNGVVHPKDDCLYMAAGSVIARNNAGSWTLIALQLPSGGSVTCMSEFNDYLAIGYNNNEGKSIVYLWDRNSSLTTIAYSLDWGVGAIKCLEQIEEYLVGVSVVGTAGLYPKMVFRKYISGAGGEVFNELNASSAVGLQVVPNSYKINNRMYFAGGITIDGTLHNGIFAVQRPGGSTILSSKEFAVWIDRLPNNDTAISASSLLGFIYINDYVYIAYNDSGYKSTYTNSNATAYSATSIVETVINPEMKEEHKTKNKTMMVVAVTTVPFGVDGGKYIVEYKVDGGSWTTISTLTSSATITNEFTCDATGAAFTSGREYKLRIKLGGAAGDATELVELKYSYIIRDTLI